MIKLSAWADLLLAGLVIGIWILFVVVNVQYQPGQQRDGSDK